MTVRLYSTTPASNNSAPPNGWPEGQAASTINDCARQMMAEIRETFEELPYFDYGNTPTRVDNDTFTVSGDLTARYPVGARVKLVGATTGTAIITASAHAAGTTTIDVTMDSGNVPTSLVRVAVQPSSGSTATPTSVSLSANAAGTSVGLSRADHVHQLSQTIAPTWTAQHTYSLVRAANSFAISMDSNAPAIRWREADGAADNRSWVMIPVGEQWQFVIINDADNAVGTVMTVDRTGTTVDRVAFPADNNASAFSVGSAPTTTGAMAHIASATASTSALMTKSQTDATATLAVWNTSTSGNNRFQEFYTEGGSGTSRGTIAYNRAGGLVAYNTTSDRRLKQNIRDAESSGSMIDSIRVVSFDWKGMPGSSQRWWVVAQELATVMPEAVSIPEDDNKGSWAVDVSKLVPLLLKELQSVRARLAVLEGARK